MVTKDIQQTQTDRAITLLHIERSIFQWNWANYIASRKDEVTPWLQAFVNARVWIEGKK